MYERRNIRLFISLIALSVITVLLFVLGSDGHRAEVDKTLFRVADQAKVDRVVMQSPKGKTELKFENSVWKVNGYDADRQSIKIFFAVLAQAEAKRAVAESLRDSVRKEIEKNGTHLQLYEGNDLRKEFYVGANEQKTETYFLQAGDKTPYVVVIPGYRVLVASVFDQTANDLRDRLIFHLRWENFKSLTATFPKDASQSFAVAYKDNYFQVEGLAATDTTKLNNYLDALSLLQADKIMTTDEAKRYDSVMQLPSLMQIKIADIADRNYELDIFAPAKGGEWVVARTGNNEAILLRTQVAATFLKRKDYFKK